jgi:D-alanine-D-alanine ligase
MDKEYMKLVLMARGLAVTPFTVIHAADWERDAPAARQAARGLGLPAFVKPARGGSSIGISKVSAWTEFDAAVAEALRHDPKVLVEAAIVGREIECGVLDGDDGPEASLPAEIRVTGGQDFYAFEAKYLDDATSLEVPADLADDVTARVREVAVAAFRALDCEGLARVDFFLRDDGALIINEVNTMPGFTPASMFPRMWAAAGVGYARLVDRLLRSALRRGTGLR